nr:MAG TPA: hypothetical protein [Caudoviricetes sp.]
MVSYMWATSFSVKRERSFSIKVKSKNLII